MSCILHPVTFCALLVCPHAQQPTLPPVEEQTVQPCFPCLPWNGSLTVGALCSCRNGNIIFLGISAPNATWCTDTIATYVKSRTTMCLCQPRSTAPAYNALEMLVRASAPPMTTSVRLRRSKKEKTRAPLSATKMLPAWRQASKYEIQGLACRLFICNFSRYEAVGRNKI